MSADPTPSRSEGSSESILSRSLENRGSGGAVMAKKKDADLELECAKRDLTDAIEHAVTMQTQTNYAWEAVSRAQKRVATANRRLVNEARAAAEAGSGNG